MLLKNDAIEDIISIIKERKGHHIPIAMSFLTSYLVFFDFNMAIYTLLFPLH